MKRMEWLDDKKARIVDMYKDGYTQIEIAKEFNVSQTAISLRLRKWDVSNSDGNRFKRKNISEDELYDMYWNKEMHPREIAKIFNCTFVTVHNYMKKYGIPTRTKSEARKGKLNPIYGVGHTKEAKRKMSQALASDRKIGFNNHWGKGSYYDTPNQGKVWMRSGWEVKVADYLTEKNIDWYYEHEWLSITDDLNYLPDFYLPGFNCFIEVKGRKKKKDMEKFNLAQKKYNILLWDGEELLKRGIISNSGSTEINKKVKEAQTNGR